MEPSRISQSTPLIPITVAADLLAVHTRTLMMYEKEGLVLPKRARGGRRLYSKKDIERIQFIRFLTTKKGLNLAGVREVFLLVKKARSYGVDLVALLYPHFDH